MAHTNEDLFASFNFSSVAASLEAVKISFTNFRTSLDGGMNFLRRRFSSGDLQGELKNDDELNFSRLNFTKKGPSPSAPSSPSKTQNTAGGLTRLFLIVKSSENFGIEQNTHCKQVTHTYFINSLMFDKK